MPSRQRAGTSVGAYLFQTRLAEVGAKAVYLCGKRLMIQAGRRENHVNGQLRVEPLNFRHLSPRGIVPPDFHIVNGQVSVSPKIMGKMS